MFVEAILIGCLTGFVAAFFGIGGSSIDTPVIRLVLSLSPLLALGTPLPLTAVTAVIAFLAYRRLHLVRMRIMALTVAGALPAIIAGSLLTSVLSGKFLMLLTAVVLFFIGIDFIIKDVTESRFAGRPLHRQPRALLVLAIAAAIGLLSGILANGGGIFFVPAYVILLKLRMREAISTSLMVVGIIAVPASIVHAALGHVDWTVLLGMAIGVIPMAYLGARLDIRTRSRTLMFLYGIFLSAFAVYFFISQAMTL